MKYAQIENGKVVNVIELNQVVTEWAGLPVVQSNTAGIDDDYINGQFIKPVKPEPIVVPETPEQTISRLESSLDRYLDAQAQSFRYESIRTMVTYENDPNPKFNAEGVGAKAFRSSVYTLGVSLIDEVQSGLREVPTESELLALMPKLEDFVTY